MENDEISGLGYLWDPKQGVELEGEIHEGVLHGEGMKRDLATGRTVFGKFVRGDIRSLSALENKGESVEGSLLSLKRRIHLHALEFTNDYLNERAIYLLHNFFETMVENEVSYSQFLKQREKKTTPSLLTLRREPSTQELAYSINEYNMIKNALSSRRP
jgi:hypothetical protein